MSKNATSNDATPMMMAMSQSEFGDPSVLKLTKMQRPTPDISQILIKVQVAGVNPTDWKHRSAERFLGEPPYVLGWDVAGVVESVGLGVTIFKPGDVVMGMLLYPKGVGSHAEYVVGPARAFVKKPERVDIIQAGALPLAALTAWQSLVDTAQVEAGDRVLIHAAAGGVGHLAVQIAKSLGAYVIGTASAQKHELVKSLGADEMVDYQNVDFVEVVGHVDVVLDTIGDEYQLRSLRTLSKDGTLVSTVPRAAEGLFEEAKNRNVRAELILVEADQQGMRNVAQLAERGELRAIIAGEYALAEAAKAHEAGETNRTTGKMVLVME
ncbi:MAG TPA: NADP-dependent oxidoreductase [Microbacteriaceae bacterium]|nr:NADP-dependent oxidoreductase [Microbacteriaceae bacterium]